MAPTTKQITGAKNGGTRTIATKQSKYYPAEKVAVPKKCRKVAKAPRTSTKLVPGTIAILLSGPHRGKRVVVLKQMGALILVTGPYKVNGVPLRRVNRRYALATQTKIDVAKVDVAKFDDAYFKAEKDNKKKAGLVKTEDNTKVDHTLYSNTVPIRYAHLYASYTSCYVGQHKIRDTCNVLSETVY